jgi:chromosome segregation ATPase
VRLASPKPLSNFSRGALMAVLAFDTYHYVKKLRDAGLPEIQAEAHADALKGLIEQNLATKQDLWDVKRDLKEDIAELRQELKDDIAEVRNELKDVRQELKNDIAEVRQELKDVRQELKNDIAELRQELKDDISELKQDNSSLRHELKQDILTLRADTRTALARVDAKIESSQNTIIKWLIGLFISQIGITIALIKLL